MPAPGSCGSNHGLADASTTCKLSRSTGSPAGSGPSRTCGTPASTPSATTCTRTTTRRTGSDLEPAQEEEGSQLRALLQRPGRSEEHTSELQSLMRTTYAVFCL